MKLHDYLQMVRSSVTDFGRGFVLGLAASKLDEWENRYLLHVALQMNRGGTA